MSLGIYMDLSAPVWRARNFRASLNWRTRTENTRTCVRECLEATYE